MKIEEIVFLFFQHFFDSIAFSEFSNIYFHQTTKKEKKKRGNYQIEFLFGV